MANAQELSIRDKKELVTKDEKTIPGRYYVPYADIYETEQSLTLVAGSDEAGRTSQSEAGHLFRREAGRGSDLMPVTVWAFRQV
ncbi:MAG TPA: hypothetical protein VFG62_20005 [Rhodopila sp.]|nr:hypothetical protein [Rhodopila sp.]